MLSELGQGTPNGYLALAGNLVTILISSPTSTLPARNDHTHGVKVQHAAAVVTLDLGPICRDSSSPTARASKYEGIGTSCLKWKVWVPEGPEEGFELS